MNIDLNIHKKIKNNWICTLCLFVIIYFGFQTICGNRNIYRLIALKNEISQAQDTADKLRQEKNRLQKLVNNLSDKSLDPDLLDERARVVLNMVADDEFVIFTDSL